MTSSASWATTRWNTPASFYRPPATESGKRVAIVGAGPAGLTAAYFLRQAGHDVTVLDQMPEAGGMLTYSIPAYRMPKDVMAAQVRALEGMGIRFELGAALGGDGASLHDLRERYESLVPGDRPLEREVAQAGEGRVARLRSRSS